MAGTLPIAAASGAASAAASRPWKRVVALAGGALLVLGVIAAGSVWLLGSSAAPSVVTGETATAVKDRLVVTITESGEIDAKRSTNVVCEVEGQSTITWVIEEGTVVKAGDKLMQLDSADLQESVRTQEMTYKTAKAAFEKADKTLAITESTRESLLSAAGLTVKFGLADLRKYLGTELADRLIAAEGKMPFDSLIKDVGLGGAALQGKRKLQTDIDLAEEELSRAASKVEWTRTLKEKGYVTGSELQADELAWKRQQVLLDQAKTALDLFLLYEFPKAAEKAYTDWLEAKRECDRVDARTSSEVASATSDRDTKLAAMNLEETHFKKVTEQLAKTMISAPQPGMVVFDTGGGRWDRQAAIEAGATVRHQQNLFKLPDMSEMNVKIKLHESVVKQAVEGAPAYVTIDAFPKERLTGKVTKVAVMPDRSQLWLNPGLKTYVTEITLDATPQGLKPGMSAQVEVLVDTREDVLQVPIAAVFVDQAFQVVYVKTPAGPQTRRVEVGLSNARSVEITKGLEAGEEVYLYKPAGVEELKVSDEEKKSRQEAEWKKAAAARKPPADGDPDNGAPENGRSGRGDRPGRDNGEKPARDGGKPARDAVKPRAEKAPGDAPALGAPKPAAKADAAPAPGAKP